MAQDTPTVVVARDGSRPVPEDRRELSGVHTHREGVGQPRALARGAAIGRYLTIDRIGAGGMGVVYSAYDPELGRKVALKVVRIGSDEDASAGRQRLTREAQALARLSHANVIPVYDVGPYEDGLFVAMELVEGTTLRGWLAAAPRSWRETRDVYVLAGQGLCAAHAARLVHRDFKPENVLVGKDGRVRVTDFGLARESGTLSSLPPPPPKSSDPEPISAPLTPITLAGTIMGTPPYMAPEQLAGQAADQRSDQWSFCAAFYEALYGAHPFARADIESQKLAVAEGLINPPPAGSGVPAWIRRPVLRGLSQNPDERWPSLPELLAALGADKVHARRRAVGLSAAVLVATTAIAVVVGQSLGHTEVCGGADLLVAGVWDGGTRHNVDTAFRATGVAFAGDSAAAVTRSLDAYAASWASMSKEACRATRVLGVQPEVVLDARVGCLNRRLSELERLVVLLERADATTVERAPQAAASLPPIVECAAPDPRERGASAVVQATRGRLDEVEALRHAGRAAEAGALATQVALEAQALRHPALVGEALYERGIMEANAGSARAAQSTFVDSASSAIVAGDEMTALDAWIELAHTLAADLGTFDEALRWNRLAEAAASRLDPRGSRAADVARTFGKVYQELGRFDDAEKAYRRSLALEESLRGGDHFDVGVLQSDLGVLALRRGKLEDADRYFRRSLDIERRALGDHHPFLATTLTNLANVALLMARLDDAMRWGQEAVELRERHLGPDHPDLATSLGILGLVHDARGEQSEALALLRRALDIDAKNDSEGLAYAGQLSDIGGVYHRLGEFEKARDANLRSMTIREKKLGPDHVDVAANLTNMGIEEKALGRYLEADAHYRKALAIMEKQLGPDNLDVGILLDNQGEILRLLGRPREAIDVYRRSVAIVEKELGTSHPIVADPLTGLGRSEIALGRARDALPVLERALALREPGPDDTNLAETRFALAQALVATGGSKPRAQELVARARAVYAAGGPTRARQVAEIDAWRAHP